MVISRRSVIFIEDSPRPSVDAGLFLALSITTVRLFMKTCLSALSGRNDIERENGNRHGANPEIGGVQQKKVACEHPI